MWAILQQDQPDDYVLATGETRTVREFVEAAFAVANTRIAWKGEGINETGVDARGRTMVYIDPKYFRPTEVNILLGDASKARDVLGWKPTVPFSELVKEMVAEDLKTVLLERERVERDV